MAKPFDSTLRSLLEVEPKSWLALLKRKGSQVSLIDSDVSTVTAATDKVIRVGRPSPWLLHLEFQASPDQSLPQRVSVYNPLLEHRHNLPVQSVVVLLRREANLTNLTGVYERSLPDASQPYRRLEYGVLRVWELDAEDLLQCGASVLPLAPISNVDQNDLPDLIRTMGETIQKCKPKQRQMLWTSTYVLLGLRYEDALIQQLMQGVTQMEESSTWQAIMQRGREQGREEGREEHARHTLLDLGTIKFGEPSKKVQNALTKITDVERLDALTRSLLSAESWDELLKQA